MTEMWVERVITTDGVAKWTPQHETFDLDSDFSVNDTQLSLETAKMGRAMVRYGTIAAEQKANLERKTEEVKYVKARVGAALRSQAEASSTKMTEASLSEQVTLDASYQAALNELHVLRANALKAESWFRSILKNADLLAAASFRHGAELKRMSA